MRAPPILHAAAGSPAPRRETHVAVGRCYWCASVIAAQACRVADVITDSFTDQDQALVRGSPWLCVACAWSMTGRPPDTIRLWSLAYRDDDVAWPPNHAAAPNLGPQVIAHNKADPSAFRALLRSPPAIGRWICSIADSGQIHTLPFAPVNAGAASYGVRYERQTISTTAVQYTTLDDSIAALMSAGFTKQDIAGEPFPSRLATCGIDLWRTHQRVLSPWRGSGLLDLVLFLARKDKTDGSGSATAVRDRSGAHDDGLGVVGEDPANRVVEQSQDSAGDRGVKRGQLRIDGLGDGPQAPDRRDDYPHGNGGRRPRKARR